LGRQVAQALDQFVPSRDRQGAYQLAADTVLVTAFTGHVSPTELSAVAKRKALSEMCADYNGPLPSVRSGNETAHASRMIPKLRAWVLAFGASAASSESAAVDPIALIDPELRPAAELMRAMAANSAPISIETLPTLRARDFLFGPQLADVPLSERRLPAGAGAPEVTIFVINAKPGASRPAILSLHGGGLIMGSAKSEVPVLQSQAKALDCAIVTVEYRLAPETRWSGSLEDNYAGLKWLYDHAEELGVDRARIAVAGGSAGGGHAARLAFAARDRGEVPLCFQMLQSPMLDDRTGSSQQPPAHLGSVSWSRELNRFGWRSFLGQAPGGKGVPVQAVPARVENLAGLPPTFISVGSLDLFVNESIDYARRLINAGVRTELYVAPGAFHGSEGMAPDAAVSRDQRAAAQAALRRAFGLPAAA
jgi:acetyl esterase/lipase